MAIASPLLEPSKCSVNPAEDGKLVFSYGHIDKAAYGNEVPDAIGRIEESLKLSGIENIVKSKNGIRFELDESNTERAMQQASVTLLEATLSSIRENATSAIKSVLNRAGIPESEWSERIGDTLTTRQRIGRGVIHARLEQRAAVER